MGLFSASLRLCLLYFLFTAEKGLGNTAELSSSSSSVIIQEKTVANGVESDEVVVVPYRLTEKTSVLQERRSKDSQLQDGDTLHPPSSMEGQLVMHGEDGKDCASSLLL